MTEDDILRLMTAGEGQTVEFKEALGLRAAGTKSLVAFANRDGGKVLFGVVNDGTLRGVTVGDNTLENLANFITSHTYPSLPVHIESVKIAGRSVVLAEAPSDRPPIIGLYLYSSDSLSPDDPARAKQLVALRRVGRTNQTADLMWLRPDMPTDPRLRLDVTYRWSDPDEILDSSATARVWMEQGSASAHEISVRAEPPVFVSDEILADLPTPYESGGGKRYRKADILPPPARVYGWETFEDIDMERDEKEPADDFWLVSTYSDDLGIRWESRRHVKHEGVVTEHGDIIRRVPGRFTRRITVFPPKRIVES